MLHIFVRGAAIILALVASVLAAAQPIPVYEVGAPLEGEPIPARQDSSADPDYTNAGQQQTAPADITPALEAIEGPKSDLIADEGADERQRQEHREIADLQAQQDMAVWAKLMTWATWVGVFLTAVALLLIWRTLHHTRVASQAAVAAVIEAEKTVEITRQIGMAQVRAYVAIINAVIHEFAVGKVPFVRVQIKNGGQSPAYGLRAKSQLKIAIPHNAMKIGFGMLNSNRQSVATLNSNATVAIELRFGKVLDHTMLERIKTGQEVIVVGVYVSCRDVFGRRRRTIAKMDLDINSITNDGKGDFRACHKGNRST